MTEKKDDEEEEEKEEEKVANKVHSHLMLRTLVLKSPNTKLIIWDLNLCTTKILMLSLHSLNIKQSPI